MKTLRKFILYTVGIFSAISVAVAAVLGGLYLLIQWLGEDYVGFAAWGIVVLLISMTIAWFKVDG